MTKDELLELLREKSFEEFNKSRDKDELSLLDLTEIDFSGIELKDIDLSNTDLSGSDFAEAELQSVNFSNSDLTSVNFSRSSLSHCNFSDSILNGTTICSGSAIECDFTDADLSGTDFSESDVSTCDFALSENMSMCKFDNTTIWPDHDKLPEDFDSEYIEDLALLCDQEEQTAEYDY